MAILLYIPNIIGYIRILLLLVSIFYTGRVFIILYSISMALDFVDGYSARYFNQCSVLGSVLDMVTDRISTVIIIMKIVVLNNQSLYTLLPLLFLDFISHFLHFTVSLILKENHKSFISCPVIRFYYKKVVLFTICTFTELSFVLLYILVLNKDRTSLYKYLLYGVYCIKSFFHVYQLKDALIKYSSIELNSKKD